MKNRTLAGLMAAPLMVFALSLPAAAADSATTTCQGWHHHHLDGQGDVQRSRRHAEGREIHGCANGTGSGAAAPAAAPAARPPHLPHRPVGSNDDVRGRHHQYIDRQGHLQRSWRRTESQQSCARKGREHSGAGRRAGRCCSRLPQQRQLRPPPSQPRRPSRRRPPPPATPIPPVRPPSARTAPTRSRRTAAAPARATAASADAG